MTNVMHLASTLLTFPSCQAIFHQHQPMVSMISFGVQLNDLDLQSCSLKSDQILECKTLTSNSQGRIDPVST